MCCPWLEEAVKVYVSIKAAFVNVCIDICGPAVTVSPGSQSEIWSGRVKINKMLVNMTDCRKFIFPCNVTGHCRVARICYLTLVRGYIFPVF